MPSVPRALLLDFGGVIVDGDRRTGWADGLADTVRGLLLRHGAPVPGSLDEDLSAGADAYGRWGDAMCRPAAPREIAHREYWSEFVGADWPAESRAIVSARAAELCCLVGRLRHEWLPRTGIRELLDAAVELGISLAIVSNTLYGAVHREFLASSGLADRFGAQLYSDEIGVRKPNPELIWRAAQALGIPAGDAWYVGDTWSRDVRCGRRAGVGCTVLMHSSRTGADRPASDLRPDLTVTDPADLVRVLTSLDGTRG
jgi:FMN phosphatase YigB (HAD superfamily)